MVPYAFKKCTVTCRYPLSQKDSIFFQFFFKYIRRASKAVGAKHYIVIALTLCYILHYCMMLQHSGEKLLFLWVIASSSYEPLSHPKVIALSKFEPLWLLKVFSLYPVFWKPIISSNPQSYLHRFFVTSFLWYRYIYGIGTSLQFMPNSVFLNVSYFCSF
jgi:hypothetical protein